jgi:hypothetical protein
MLEFYFENAVRLRQFRQCPVDKHLDGFADLLRAAGYKRRPGQLVLRGAAHLGLWAARVRTDRINAGVLDAFARHLRTCVCAHPFWGKGALPPGRGAALHRAFATRRRRAVTPTRARARAPRGREVHGVDAAPAPRRAGLHVGKLRACRGENFAYLFGWVAGSLGQVYAHIGRVLDGVALLRQAAEQSTAMKIMARYPRLETLLGEAHLRASTTRPWPRRGAPSSSPAPTGNAGWRPTHYGFLARSKRPPTRPTSQPPTRPTAQPWRSPRSSAHAPSSPTATETTSQFLMIGQLVPSATGDVHLLSA